MGRFDEPLKKTLKKEEQKGCEISGILIGLCPKLLEHADVLKSLNYYFTIYFFLNEPKNTSFIFLRKECLNETSG